MVRRLICSLALAVIALSALAEVHYKSQIRVGGKAGMTLSSMTFSPTVEQKMVAGFIAGATVSYAEEKLFGLRAEILVEQRGWQEDFKEFASKFSYSRRLTYVQVPILTQITFGGRRFKCVVTAGPEISYMIGESIDANFDYHNIGSITDFPEENRMNEQLVMPIKNKLDYGISAGVGGEWRVNRQHAVNLDARFYFGLGNIFPDHKRDVFNASRAMSFQFTAGYSFRLK